MKSSDISDQLFAYENNWEIYCAEDGRDITERSFLILIAKAHKVGMKTIDHFPDGTPFPA